MLGRELEALRDSRYAEQAAMVPHLHPKPYTLNS